MPALTQVAAFINDGTVVNVGALSTDNDYEAAHAALADKYDEIRVVPRAGIGWLVWEDGSLRPPKPHEDAVWDEDAGWWLWTPDEVEEGS
jgi:hypothetical protein